jgi:hypothetical protein
VVLKVENVRTETSTTETQRNAEGEEKAKRWGQKDEEGCKIMRGNIFAPIFLPKTFLCVPLRPSASLRLF